MTKPKPLGGHAGSIHRDTQAGRVYRALKENWYSSGRLYELAKERGKRISNITAAISQVHAQLPGDEVILVRGMYRNFSAAHWKNIHAEGEKLYDEFHIFESKKAARAWVKKTKPRSWRYWGDK